MKGSPRSARISAIGVMILPPTLMSRNAKSNSAVRANGSAALIDPASATTRCPSSSSISAVIIRSSASSSTRKKAAFFIRLIGRSARVEQLRNRRNKLGRREWLFEKDTVGHTVGRPNASGGTRYVDYRKCWIDLARGFCDFPAVHQALESYVCDKCSIIRDLTLEEGQGFFGGCGDRGCKTGFIQRLVNDSLYCKIVLDNEDDR